MHVALPAEGAFDFSRQEAGVQGLVGQRAKLPAPRHFGLHIIEGLFVDDRFMGVGHKVLRKLPAILLLFLRDGISGEFLLQEQVPGVGDVAQDALDVRIHPAASVPGGNALRSKLTLGFQPGLSVEKVLKNALYDGCFLRSGHQRIALPVVSVHPEVSRRDALLHALSLAPFDVVRNAPAFFLGKRGQ